jgi:tRNA threonylcarbamoyladenosine biosynthesis protein TsaE
MRIELTPGGLYVELESETETDLLGRSLANAVTPGTVIGLEGPLGAGKTRLVRAIAEALDVAPSAIASPTFVLIHEYDGRLPIYHFDAYRLKDPDSFDALGAADYFAGDGLCLVEWADRVLARLPEETWLVRLEVSGAAARRATLRGTGPWELIARELAGGRTPDSPSRASP